MDDQISNGQNATLKKCLPDWTEQFLVGLRNSANVRLACQKAGIDRPTAYRLRERSKTFAAQWDVALEEAIDILEAEAWKRGTSVSDVLLIFLLKAHRPEKYRETTKHVVTGDATEPVVIKVVYGDEGDK
jgi:hypothetical protein